jgi:hypothetical protein
MFAADVRYRAAGDYMLTTAGRRNRQARKRLRRASLICG